jgi:nucleotide-binding universal stress UspA family protein
VKTIVVGYDATEPSERALARAAELAEAFGAQLVVVSVVPLMPVDVVPPGGEPFLMPVPPLAIDSVTAGLESREAAEQRLKRARAALAGRSVKAEYVTTLGDPGDELVSAAEKHGADLIVVGTREPGFLERLFGGSVSREVARSAHCDVLIVHPGRPTP